MYKLTTFYVNGALSEILYTDRERADKVARDRLTWAAVESVTIEEVTV